MAVPELEEWIVWMKGVLRAAAEDAATVLPLGSREKRAIDFRISINIADSSDPGNRVAVWQIVDREEVDFG
jgi:hypothetical protein